MTPVREDVIHFYMRHGLREDGWFLVAGQFPNGSDDELRALNVVDPAVARDRSPRPRHHSQDKLVPDLVAVKGMDMVVVEAKPLYDEADERKLMELLGGRRSDFDAALSPLLLDAGISLDAGDLRLIPTLAFSAGAPHPVRTGFAYIEVGAQGSFKLTQPNERSQ